MFRRIPRRAGSRPTTAPISSISSRPSNQVWASIPGSWIIPPLAALTAGTEVVRLPINGMPLKRYARVYYTVATGPLTAGKFNAAIVNKAQAWMAHADSPNVT